MTLRRMSHHWPSTTSSKRLRRSASPGFGSRRRGDWCSRRCSPPMVPSPQATWLESSGIDESSVYRNLEVLEHHGLIRHLHLGHSAGLYILVSEAEVEYLYCERCAKVTTVTPARLDPLRERIKREFGFTARFAHFPIVGVCDECAPRGARNYHRVALGPENTSSLPQSAPVAPVRLIQSRTAGVYAISAHPSRDR